MTPWEIEAVELVTCNCAYGCPCQFNALPTHGNCEAVAGMEIKRGFFADTTLDGLKTVAVMWWPGPIHEGGGKALIIVDERASDAQRDALLAILSGMETEPGATIWNVFAATLEEVFEPVFRSIDFAADVDARLGHVRVEGLVSTSGKPIRNPVTGEEHRVRIDLPNGFEYTLAEMGASTIHTNGPIKMDFENRYAQFAHIHLNNQGVVRDRAA
ncbi:DUF1326 domain-containing protein [Haliea sp. E17]|uniref:DUF1326 domain-containing protein n=1 Tax=Haliea sp. E17 TaxID=3401576 RepID=UPI003AAEC558